MSTTVDTSSNTESPDVESSNVESLSRVDHTDSLAAPVSDNRSSASSEVTDAGKWLVC
jgi:hypothetical protein